jgi:hypothetical protein
MEPIASLPCLQRPSADPYAELDISSAYHTIRSLKDSFHYYPSIYVFLDIRNPSFLLDL